MYLENLCLTSARKGTFPKHLTTYNVCIMVIATYVSRKNVLYAIRRYLKIITYCEARYQCYRDATLSYRRKIGEFLVFFNGSRRRNR